MSENPVLDELIAETTAKRMKRFKDMQAHAAECHRQWAASEVETQRLESRKRTAETERDVALYYLLRHTVGVNPAEVQDVAFLMMQKDDILKDAENTFVTELEVAAASKIDIYRTQNGGSTFEYTESVDVQPGSISVPGRDAQATPPNLVEG